MPNEIQGHKVDEEKWNKAKEIASKEGHADEYDYIMGVYKKMVGLKHAFQYNINDGFSAYENVTIKGERKYYVEGYASTIDEDKAGEIISLEAQQDIYHQIQSENITMDLEHELWYDNNGNVLPRPSNDKIPVARIVDAKLDHKGVWVKAELNTSLRSFQELWGSIKGGFLKAFSVAFYPIQKAGGVIKRLSLVNVTLTGSPVNPQATFAASMKSAVAYLDSLENPNFVENSAQPVDNSNTLFTLEDNSRVETIIKHTGGNNMVDKKAEEAEKKIKCPDCDKEFESKEALKEHKESAHKEEVKAEKEEKESKEHEAKESKKEEKAEDEEPEKKAKVKAETLDADIKALREEVAALKAELNKPVMKAIVQKEEVKLTPTMVPVSPLNLIR